jgi:hypothetical protein
MFGSGDTSNFAPPEKKLANISPDQTASNEQGRPLPVVYGCRLVPMTFISNPFNVWSQEQKQEVGKDEEVTVGYWYVCSFAALLCHGPVDQLRSIRDGDTGEVLWTGPLTRPTNSDLYSTVNIGSSVLRFYWGKETQTTIDEDLATLSASYVGRNSNNPEEEHPAYTGQCYVVADNYYLGYQNTRVPNLLFEIARWPYKTWITQTDGGIEQDAPNYDSCPANIIADMVCDTRFGLGLTDSDLATIFDRASFNTVNRQLYSEGFGISPVFDSVQTFWQACVQMLEYCDGFIYSTDAGKIALGVVRKLTCSGLPLLSEEHLVDRPEFDIQGSANARNDVRVRFTAFENGYQSDSTPSFSSTAIESLGGSNLVVLDRPWAMNAAVATKMAKVAAQVMSQPTVAVRLRVRKDQLQALAPGSGFHFAYSPLGMCWQHFRVLSISHPDPYKPTVEIEAERDRGMLNSVPVSVAIAPAPDKPDRSPKALVHQAVIELPCYKQTRADASIPSLTVLCSRSFPLMNMAAVWFEKAANDFEQKLSISKFAVHGTLDDDYSAAATGAISFTVDSEYDEVPDEIDEPAGDDTTWILIIGSEIMRPYGVTVLGANQYQVSVKREALDTAKQAHSEGDQIWLIKYAALLANSFRTGITTTVGTSLTVKIQPYSGKTAYALSSCTEISTTFSKRFHRPWKPKSLHVTGTYNGSGSLTFAWTGTSNQGGYTIGKPAPRWVLDIRAAGAAFDLDDPTDGQVLSYKLHCQEESQVVTMAEITAALGSLVDIDARCYAVEDDLVSRETEFITVTKV